MELIPVKVECHSGYKADEYPVRFYFGKFSIDIIDVVDRWYQANKNTVFPEANYFKVLSRDKKQFILKQEQKSGKWFLLVHGEKMSL